MILELNEVTLVCVDTRDIEGALHSMRSSLGNAQFGESILITSKGLCSDKYISEAKNLGIKLEFITEIKSISDYSYFVLVELDRYIKTNFCLITHWDGWVIDKKFWDSDFLNYDYIGALWPHYSENKIGNGGFSLRSKRLLESTRNYILSISDFSTPLIEDDYICREKKKVFEEKYKIKFPTDEIANRFSVERSGDPLKSFGFHGMFNFNIVIKKDFDLIRLINILSDECFVDRASYDLTKSLLEEKKITIAKLIIKRRLSRTGLTTKNVKLICFLLIKVPLTQLLGDKK